MENKKLIKLIKKQVIKNFEEDVKKTILKDLYNSSSKKQIQKIKKQILKEVQEDLFGIKSKKEVEILEACFIHTNTDDVKDSDTHSKEDINESKEQESSIHESGKTFEYRGFKFDVDRMSQIVTGKKNLKKTRQDLSKKSTLESFLKSNLQSNLSRENFTSINLMDNNLKKNLDFNLPDGVSINREFMRPPVSKNIVSYSEQINTPSTKEELSFFLEKLKSSISKLGKGERNINYRHKKDDVYLFTFFKSKNILDKDDFSLNFSIDFDIKTNAANINLFEFDIENFKFNASFFKLIDISRVLDLVGMNLNYYINEINEVNSSEQVQFKNNSSVEIIDSKSINRLDKFIFDKKIISILKNNDITTYDQLINIKDLTSINGIGSKTAEKIQQFLIKI